MSRFSVGLLTILGMLLLGGVVAAGATLLPDAHVIVPGQAVPETAAAAGTAAGAGSFVEQVVELVNEARWDNGQLPPLKSEVTLDGAAQTHGDNMAARNFFDHCDLDTKTLPWDRMVAAGYTGWSYAGENIAAGQTTPAEVMTGWMNSPGHRANILSTAFREIGVGYTYESGDQATVRYDSDGDCSADGTYSWPFYRYWTQTFGRRSIVYPVVINREAVETDSRSVALYLYGAGWAAEMRLRNEGEAWSAWQPFAPDVAWTLSGGNGQKEVQAEIRNGSGTVYGASDTIVLNEVIQEPVLVVSPTSLTVLADVAQPLLSEHPLRIANDGAASMMWQLTSAPPAAWLMPQMASGQLAGGAAVDAMLTVDPRGLAPGTYQTTVTVDGGSAQNSPQQVDVTLIVATLNYVFLPAVQTPR